ncbi:sensor histidine kinase [Actinomyces dentalis]|uniref:sensor histidine kinase n=1 Tax=Actinomyces dentalis TaxID=272548 RepID=UPI0023544D45|nr:histidine kinase [Actinomyces dentalis]
MTVERAGRPPGARIRPGAADVLLAALLACFCAFNPAGAPDPGGSAAVRAVFLAVTAACCTAIALRRLHPAASVGVIGAALSLHLAVMEDLSLLAIASCLVAAETTQSRMRRPWGPALLALVYAGTVLAAYRVSGFMNPETAGAYVIPLVAGWALVSVAALVGAARRRARERVERALERAAILQAQQDVERRLAVATERARIARDVHDLLGHCLSVISMQAAGARAVLAADPGAADAALGVIGETSRRAVDEVRALVDVLRADDEAADPGAAPPASAGHGAPAPASPGVFADLWDGSTAGPAAAASDGPSGGAPGGPGPAPASGAVAPPGLEDVAGLLARARRAGLPVSLSLLQTADVAPQVGEAVYRGVQEALTNVMRHAAGAPTTVTMTVGDRLDVVVDNEAPARAGAGADGARRTGAGLASMAERVAGVGGSLEAGPGPAGGWRVRIAVPAPAAGAAAGPEPGAGPGTPAGPGADAGRSAATEWDTERGAA